jgi:probable HAF family extracellular repeat protein
LVDLGWQSQRSSRATCINDKGDIVGDGYVLKGKSHALLFGTNGIADLGTLGGNNSQALTISKNGTIGGWAETATGEKRAVVWARGNQGFEIRELRSLVSYPDSWTLTKVVAVNDADVIIGVGEHNGTRRGFVMVRP